MTRTVINLFTDSVRKIVNFNLHFAPGNFQNARDLYEFTCMEFDPPFQQMSQGVLKPDVVKRAGTQLFENLSKHPAVRNAVMTTLAGPSGNIAPLCIHLNSEKVEGLPWETLYSPEWNFLELDRHWPIARIADSSAMQPEIHRTLRPPLKVMLIASAARVDSMPEWKSFYSALKGAEIELQLQVFVCQEELKTAIEGLNDARITVQYLSSRFELLNAIQQFTPHILHFFCHGSTDGGAHLRLANRADWDGEDPRGSISIVPNDLDQFASANANVSGNVWLVVLNCCQGGAVVTHATSLEDTYSLARSLVTQGFPAVIGMREPIASGDAHVFCQAFYPSVFSILQETEQQGKAGTDFTEVEWARALYQPRTQLRDLHAENQPPTVAAAACKEWTLPVIYIRPELFKLRVRSTNSALSEDEKETLLVQFRKLRAIHEMLQTLPEVPQAVLAEIDQRMADLEKQLYAQES